MMNGGYRAKFLRFPSVLELTVETMNGESSVSPELVSNDIRFSHTSQLLFLVSPFLNEIECQLNCYSRDVQ